MKVQKPNLVKYCTKKNCVGKITTFYGKRGTDIILWELLQFIIVKIATIF